MQTAVAPQPKLDYPEFQGLDRNIRKRLEASAGKWLPIFQDEVITIKIGGSLLEDSNHAALQCLAEDIRILKSIGTYPVVIHGGGKAINQALEEARIPTERIDGLRVTPLEAMGVIEDVLSNQVNLQVRDLISNSDVQAAGICGKLLFTADFIDKNKFGYVGKITAINHELLEDCLDSESVPVISSVAKTEDGELLNIDADMAASAIALELQSKRHIFVSESTLKADFRNFVSDITQVDIDHVEFLIKYGVITGGMITKVRACSDLVRRGVDAVSIIKADTSHPLLQELLLDEGVGTQFQMLEPPKDHHG